MPDQNSPTSDFFGSVSTRFGWVSEQIGSALGLLGLMAEQIGLIPRLFASIIAQSGSTSTFFDPSAF